MFNYISKNYYDNENKNVYFQEKDCLKKEGSAIPFNPKTTHLHLCKIENDVIVEDQDKIDINNVEKNEEKLKSEKKDKNLKDIRKITDLDIDSMDLTDVKELLKKLVSLV